MSFVFFCLFLFSEDISSIRIESFDEVADIVYEEVEQKKLW